MLPGPREATQRINTYSHRGRRAVASSGRLARSTGTRSRQLRPVHPGDVPWRDDLVLEVVDLERGVGNVKPISQSLLDGLHDPGCLLDRGVPGDREMAGEHDESGRDRPHVQVMNAANARDGSNRLRDLLGPKVLRRALEDDPRGVPKEACGARGDEDDDEYGDQRVHEDETSEGDQGGPRDHADGSESVPVRMDEGPANVDVLPGRATEEGHDCEIRREARQTYGEHRFPLDGLRMRNPTVHREGEGGSDHGEEHRVHEGRQDFDSMVSERQ